MRIAFYLIFSVFCLFSPACREGSTGDPSVHLYADFYVRYLASSQQLRAEARLAEGSDPPQVSALVLDGGVRFLEQAMELETPEGKPPRYTWSGVRPFPPSLFFQYERGNELQRQEMSLQPLGDYAVRSPVRPGEGLALSIGGSLLKGNEALVIILADAKNQAQSFTIEGPTRDTVHQIPPEAFTDLANGTATLYLVKRLKKTTAQANQTITSTVEYYTDTMQVKIVDFPEN